MRVPPMPDHPMEKAMSQVLDLFCARLKTRAEMIDKRRTIDDVRAEMDKLTSVIRYHHMRNVGNMYRMWLDCDTELSSSNRRTVELPGKAISDKARRNLAKLPKGEVLRHEAI